MTERKNSDGDPSSTKVPEILEMATREGKRGKQKKREKEEGRGKKNGCVIR